MDDDEKEDEGIVRTIYKKMADISEHHHFLTDIIKEHDELYKTPHLLKMYE